MIHAVIPGKFSFGTGGVTTVIFRMNSFLQHKIKFDYLSITPLKKEYEDAIHDMGGNLIIISKCRIPIIKMIIVPFIAVHILKTKKYPICYINSSAALSMLFLGIIAKIAHIPIIIGHSHCSYIDANFPMRLFKLMLHYICKPLLPLVITDYLTCSQKAATWMFPRSVIESNKIVTIHNPISILKYAYNLEIRNKKRLEHNLEQKLVIGHVGRFAYQKNHSFLLRIFREIAKKRNDAVLFLIGEGSLQKRIQREAIELGIEDEVIFFGATSLVPEYMQMFDIFLFPSRFEGLPIVGIEAQCAGLPCIFSNVISHEIEVTNNCLFLSLNSSPVKWAEAIIKFAEAFERKDCSGEIKKKGFDIQDSASRLEKVFYDVLHRMDVEA